MYSDWFSGIFRQLFILLDGVVYWAVDIMYRLFILISEVGIFTPETIRTFGSRIYVLLGVFVSFANLKILHRRIATFGTWIQKRFE